MKTSFKLLKGSKIALEVMLSAEDFKPYWESARQRAIESLNVKGFRPGAAPQELAERLLNKEKILEDAAERAVRESLNSATEEHGWVVVDGPQVKVSEMPEVAKAGGLAYAAELTVLPEVKLGGYQKISRAINAEREKISVTPEEIEKAFEWIRKSRAALARVNRPAEKGDVVEVDIRTSREGKPIQGGEIKHDRFPLGEGKFIPGFEDKLVGTKEGEDATFTITAPKDYWQKELQGQPLDFKVHMSAIFKATLPEVNDDFAKALGKFSNVGELKVSIGDGLKQEKEQKQQDDARAKILDEIVKNSTIDLPEIFITKTLDGMMEEIKKQLEHSGKNPDDARKDLRGAAEKRVAANLIIHEISKLEHLEPTKEEIEEESKHYPGAAQKLDAGKFYDYVYGILLNKKVFEFLDKQ